MVTRTNSNQIDKIRTSETVCTRSFTDHDKQYKQRKPKDKEKYRALGKYKAALKIQARPENKSENSHQESLSV